MKYITIFLVFAFCEFPAIFSNPGNTVYYASQPVYTNPKLVILEIDKDEYRKISSLLTNFDPSEYVFVPTHETRYVVHVLLSKNLLSFLKKRQVIYDILDLSYTAFSYYDPTYYPRMYKGLDSLEDLLSGYKDNILNEIYLKEIAKKYPDKVTYKSIGTTRLGKEIPAIKISSPTKKSKYKVPILFNGAHHANELISTEHCYDIIYHLLKYPDKYSAILETSDIWIVPIVNPDGSELFWHRSIQMGRKNGLLSLEHSINNPNRGVDLNRNYPYKWNTGHPRASSSNIDSAFYRGAYPASEPEVRSMIKFFDEERFVFSLSYHSYATCILYPYTIENVSNPEPDYVKKFAEKLASVAISIRPNKRFEAKKNIYPVDGTDQDYFYFQYGTNALLLESSHHNPNYPLVSKIMNGLREVWETFLKEHIEGEKIVIKIVDENQKPINALVKIKEFKYKENERHFSNPSNGMFYQMVFDHKEYSVTIEKAGYVSQTVSVLASKKLKPTKVVLKKE